MCPANAIHTLARILSRALNGCDTFCGDVLYYLTSPDGLFSQHDSRVPSRLALPHDTVAAAGAGVAVTHRIRRDVARVFRCLLVICRLRPSSLCASVVTNVPMLALPDGLNNLDAR